MVNLGVLKSSNCRFSALTRAPPRPHSLGLLTVLTTTVWMKKQNLATFFLRWYKYAIKVLALTELPIKKG